MTNPRRRPDDWVVPVWLGAALVVSGIHRWVPAATWLMLHLVLLGALTHAAVVWSEHFTQALLKTKAGITRAARANRAALAIGALAVFVGIPGEWWWLTVAGATVVSAAVLWHGWRLVRDLRRALPGRFRVTIHYYVAAALALPVGAGFGATLAVGLTDEWHARFLVAHTMTNLLGWIGLTVVGTLVTFWPTVLRTRMDPRADRLARQALPVLVAGLVIVDAAALAGLRPAAVAGLAVYAAGLVWSGRSLLVALRGRRPREFASASIGAAVVWFPIALVATGWLLATAPDARAVTAAYPTLAGLWGVGFAAQLLLGALSYLLPSVLGGGPSAVRAAAAEFDRWAAARLTAVNAGLPLWLLPATPSWVKVTVSGLGLLALAAFLPLMARGLRAGIRERRRIAAGGAPATAPLPADRPSALTSSGLLAGLTALATVVALGVAVDPAAAGLPLAARSSEVPATAPAASGLTPTGKTVEVTVTAHDMRFEPNRIEAAAGDRVVLHLVNADPTTTHDLAIAGVKSKRLAPGESETLDLGVVGGSVQGWCTVVGHRQMGMVLDLVVAGGAAPSPTAPAASGHATHGPLPDPKTPLARVVDPTLPPRSPETVHKVTFTVTEVPLEVAPGVWQQRWTFNGGPVGPTLRGKVGDVFEITLVNDGTIGHSIDFHAGALAPDQPMRTIAPGESLVYRFTAGRAGIWMYHCATHPMSSHIAAGMHGAVIVEPADLPPVDREYVLVQSEVFLTTAATSAAEATEVNADAVLAERPDLVVFNGVANQYDQRRFTARVGERVRFWVLDAGPNRPASFHIVGGQFDTLYLEGAYHLKNGRDAFGQSTGGAQALGLLPAQGGFVELTFPEPGNYPVVSHVMVDAERGAHGFVEVTT